MNVKKYIDRKIQLSVRRAFNDGFIDLAAEARRAVAETKLPQYWPSDFLHGAAAAIYREGRARGDQRILDAAKKLRAIAHVCAKINITEYESGFQKTTNLINSFDIPRLPDSTKKIHRIYKVLCNKAIEAFNK